MTARLDQFAGEIAEFAQLVENGGLQGPEAAAQLRALAEALDGAAEASARGLTLFQETAQATQADLERKLEEISLLRLIADVGGRLITAENPFRTVLESLLPITHADSISIFMLDDRTERLEFVDAAGVSKLPRRNRPSFAIGEGVAGRVAATGQPMIIADTTDSPEFTRRDDTVVTIRSLAGFPLLVAGAPIGVLNLSAAQPGVFSEGTMRVLHIIGGQLANVVQSARMLERQRAHTDQLEESERRYRELVEEVNDGFFVLGPDLRTRMANQHFTQIFGRRMEDVLAAESWAGFLSAESRDRVMEVLGRIAEGRAGLEEGIEFQVVRADATVVPVHVHCRVVQREKELVWIGMVRDMSTQKEIQRQLMQSEKLAAMGTLIAGTTHELNNKLAPILGYAQLLQRADLPDEVRRRLKVVEEAAAGAKGIVDALLGFSRDSETQREPVEVADIVDAVLGLTQSALRREGVRVVRYDDDETPAIYASRHQIEQVILNMVNNALHAMAESETKTLEIWTGTEGEGVVIGVRDTGHGVEPEHLTRIFDPFFTTKKVNEGTGLGLSLSYGIVRSHGGEIVMESTVGKGTTFRVQLPAAGHSGPVAAGIEPADPAAQLWPGRPRLLIVDDEPMVRDLLHDLFEDTCAVETAHHGRAALEAITKHEFDLLVVDVRMPDLDGFGLYSVLERDHPHLAKRIVFMTGDTYDPETQRFLDRCQRPYITKPFDLNKVVAVVRQELAALA